MRPDGPDGENAGDGEIGVDDGEWKGLKLEIYVDTSDDDVNYSLGIGNSGVRGDEVLLDEFIGSACLRMTSRDRQAG